MYRLNIVDDKLANSYDTFYLCKIMIY